MQISSRTNDFLIDTLVLREQLTVLNNIFTNPKVVKVLHGADWDIEWLQKDFGLYIVNMFDTHQAARELHFPTLSLAYLLKTFCNIDASKQYQLADWRIRFVFDVKQKKNANEKNLDRCRMNMFDMHVMIHIIYCISTID